MCVADRHHHCDALFFFRRRCFPEHGNERLHANIPSYWQEQFIWDAHCFNLKQSVCPPKYICRRYHSQHLYGTQTLEAIDQRHCRALAEWLSRPTVKIHIVAMTWVQIPVVVIGDWRSFIFLNTLTMVKLALTRQPDGDQFRSMTKMVAASVSKCMGGLQNQANSCRRKKI